MFVYIGLDFSYSFVPISSMCSGCPVHLFFFLLAITTQNYTKMNPQQFKSSSSSGTHTGLFRSGLYRSSQWQEPVCIRGLFKGLLKSSWTGFFFSVVPALPPVRVRSIMNCQCQQSIECMLPNQPRPNGVGAEPEPNKDQKPEHGEQVWPGVWPGPYILHGANPVQCSGARADINVHTSGIENRKSITILELDN